MGVCTILCQSTDGKLSKAAMRLLGKLGDFAADGGNVSKAGVVLVAQVQCANGQKQWIAAQGGRPGLAKVGQSMQFGLLRPGSNLD
jgi:hypothetical protein